MIQLKRSWVAVAAVLFVLSSVAFADVIHLKDGTELEGKILSESSKEVVLQTRFGKVPIPRSRIEKIVKGLTPKEEFQQRKAALKAGDVNGRFELAEYCRENRLNKEADKLLAEILKIDPQHDGANRALGKIEYNGRWFTKSELEKFRELEAREMEEQGLILHDGKWMSKEDAMRAQGYVEVDGQWIPREEADRMMAAREFEEIFQTPLTVTESLHFSLRSTRTIEDNQALLDIFEDGYNYFVSRCKPSPKEQEFLDYYKVHIYVLNEPQQIETFINSGFIDRYKPPKNTKERYLESTNFAYYFPIPVIVLSEGRHLKAGGSRETALIGMVTCHLGQLLVRRIKRGGGLPGWAEAGMGHHMEGILNEYLTISVIEYPFYEPAVDKWIDGWEDYSLWSQKLADPGQRQRLLSLRQLMEVPVEELRVDNLAKSWSLVSFLLDRHPDAFFAFVREAKVRFRGDVVSSTDAFEKAFEPHSIEQIEAEWTEWLATDAPVIRVGALGGGVLR